MAMLRGRALRMSWWQVKMQATYVSRRSKVILISAIARNGGSINFG